MKKALFFVAVVFSLLSCANGKKKEQAIVVSKKIRGIQLISPKERVDLPAIIELYNAKANFIGLNPEAFVDNNSQLIHPGAFPKWGDTEAGIQSLIDLAKERKMQCVISPSLRFANEDTIDWKQLENSYTDYILKFARISEQNRLLVFCIGNGLDNWVMANPTFWKNLIAKVKEVYHGDVIYSAEFSNVKNIPIWKDVTHLSVSFFEKVSNEKSPSHDTLNVSWNLWKAELKSFSEQFQKDLIITKWGYRSVDYAGNEKLYSDSLAVNQDAQLKCYESFIENCYPESWFLGSFVFRWNLEEQDTKGYSPKDKAALKAFSTIGKK